jgi:hypothetical protein
MELKRVRVIGDPDVRFREDPVRMMRAVEFAARLGFDIEAATYDALLRHRNEILKASPPRVSEEILELLRRGWSKEALRRMVAVGIARAAAPRGLRRDQRGQGAVLLENARGARPHRAGGTQDLRRGAALGADAAVGGVGAGARRAAPRFADAHRRSADSSSAICAAALRADGARRRHASSDRAGARNAVAICWSRRPIAARSSAPSIASRSTTPSRCSSSTRCRRASTSSSTGSGTRSR